MQLLKQKGVCTCVAFATVYLACAAHAADTNAVQMVTYFPVPYAQYNNLYPQNKLDIGTVNASDFKLTVGNCSGENAPAPFTADTVNLRKVAGSPVLKMQQNFKTTTATFGKTDNNAQLGTVTFGNLYLSNTPLEVSELKVSTLKASSPGKIFVLKSTLPGCSSGLVQWQELNFGTTSADKKKYLVCCDSAGSCGKTCQGMEKLKATCEKTTSLPSNAPHYGTSAQVTGSWLGSDTNNNCNCSCSGASYKAAVSNQQVTGADREGPNNAANENEDYDYCVQKCWDHTNNGTGGDVATCVNSTWQGSKVGATWNYNTCSCTCPYPYDKKNGDYGCTYRCDTEYNAGKINNCTNGSIHKGSWQVYSCTCNCGSYYKRNPSTEGCENRCVSGNPYYDAKAALCNGSEGGHWQYSDISLLCRCRCDDGYELIGDSCKKKQTNS